MAAWLDISRPPLAHHCGRGGVHRDERDWPRACSPTLSPEGGRGGGAAWGARRLPHFWPGDEAPGEADSRAAGARRVVLEAAYLVQVSAVGLPLADELWIKGPFRGATLDTAKRAEASERLVQRSPAGETEEWLPRVIVLVFLVGPACQLPQSPLSFPSFEP